MIRKNTVVTFTYKVTDDEGNLLDKSETPAAYLHGGYGNIPEHLELTLEGHVQGDRVQVNLIPEQGFGERDETLVRHEARDKLPPGNLEVGTRLQAERGDSGDVMTFTVTEIDADEVTLDGNHPLAGLDLVFDIEIVDVRYATADELSHKHVHGPEGHHH